jgi:hypothetical protein
MDFRLCHRCFDRKLCMRLIQLNRISFEAPALPSIENTGRNPGLITPTKEIVMTRMFAIAAILSLAAISAQAAESLEARVHAAAAQACAIESSASLPTAHYSAITKSCINRISTAAMRKMAADAESKTLASTAALN